MSSAEPTEPQSPDFPAASELSPDEAMQAVIDAVTRIEAGVAEEAGLNPGVYYVQEEWVDNIRHNAYLLDKSLPLNTGSGVGIELLVPAEADPELITNPRYLIRPARHEISTRDERATFSVTQNGVLIVSSGSINDFIRELISPPTLFDQGDQFAGQLFKLAAHIGMDLSPQPFRRAN